MLMNLDWEFIMESLPLYGDAMWLTVKLALIAIALSLVLGLVFSLVLFIRLKGLEALFWLTSNCRETRRCWSSCSSCITACRRWAFT